jgi:hypothetical protein
MAKIGKANIVRAEAEPMGVVPMGVVEETVRVDWFALQSLIDLLSRCGDAGESLSAAACRSQARTLCRATGLQATPAAPVHHAPVV